MSDVNVALEKGAQGANYLQHIWRMCVLLTHLLTFFVYPVHYKLSSKNCTVRKLFFEFLRTKLTKHVVISKVCRSSPCRIDFTCKF